MENNLIFSRQVFIPNHLSETDDEFQLELDNITKEKDDFINKIQELEKKKNEELDNMIKDAREKADEFIYLQRQKKMLLNLNTQKIEELTEMKLVLDDVTEELEAVKVETETIQNEMKDKIEEFNECVENLEEEKKRIQHVKDETKNKYKLLNSQIKMFSQLFNCSLSKVEENNTTQEDIYKLILKKKNEPKVTITFQTSDYGNTIQLLDIKSSPSLDNEILDSIRNTLSESQDTQGLLSFLHKTFVNNDII